MIDDGDAKKIVVVENFLLRNDTPYVVGRYYTEVEDLYSHPIPSSRLDIYKVKDKLSPILEIWPLLSVVAKCYRIPQQFTGMFGIFPIWLSFGDDDDDEE